MPTLTPYLNPASVYNVSHITNPNNILSNENTYCYVTTGYGYGLIEVQNFNFSSVLSKYDAIIGLSIKNKSQRINTENEINAVNDIVNIKINDVSIKNYYYSFSSTATINIYSLSRTFTLEELSSLRIAHDIDCPYNPNARLFISQVAVNYNKAVSQAVNIYTGTHTAGSDPTHIVKDIPETARLDKTFEIGVHLSTKTFTTEQIRIQTNLPSNFSILDINYAHTDMDIFENIDIENNDIVFNIKYSRLTDEYKDFRIILQVKMDSESTNNSMNLVESVSNLSTLVSLPQVFFTGFKFKGQKTQLSDESRYLLFEDTDYIFKYVGENLSLINNSNWIMSTPENYLGVVQVEKLPLADSLDFEFQNPVVNKTYQNREVIGKTGDYSESLGIIIRGKKNIADTIIGMCRADMPFPVDLSHGQVKTSSIDPLIHKGWAVFEKVKINSINNKQNDYDITLHYLTHELEVPILINNLGRTNLNYLTGAYPDTVLLPTDDLKNYFNIIGSYNSLNNNILTLGYNKNASLISKNPIGQPYNLVMDWISDIGFNPDLIERNILIKDDEGYEILRYSLHDFNEETGEIIATITVGNTVIEEIIYLKVTTDEPSNPEEDLYTINGNILTYGSITNININNGIISILEEGWTGSELYTEEGIYSDNYLIEIQIITKGEATTTTNFAFEVDETFLIQNKSMNYTNLIVSSSPIKDKIVLFTRKSDEGLLYYYQQDEDTFKYGTNPLIRWKGGVNVTSLDGTSFLSTQYTIDPLAITNGIVKMEFSKKLHYIKLYLYSNDTWNFICKFKLENMDVTKANTIDYDKSIIESNKNLFTMYRGHHFIDIIHSDDDIFISTLFDYYKHLENGIFERVDIDQATDNVDFNNFYYIKLENDNSNYGLLVVKTDFTNIFINKIPRSNKTILIPYNKNGTDYNDPENLIIEWLNHTEQQTIIGA